MPDAGLPATVPVPLPRPDRDMAHPIPVPKPSDRPPEKNAEPEKPGTGGPAAETKPEGKTGPPVPFGPPMPEKREQNGSALPTQPGTPDGGPASQPEIIRENPEELKACLSELTTLGARFTRADPVEEGQNCGIAQPVRVDEILPGLSLGGAVIRCQTAAGLAHWLKATVQPALGVARPGRAITRVIPGTTYACRLRNSASSGTISEHALGNAFDVAAFELDNGETIEMKPRADDHTLEGAFQKAITAGACLYFTTVLAPGSDASHETHMHADIRAREGGYRICQSP